MYRLLDSQSEQACNESLLGPHIVDGNGGNLSLAQHEHGFDSRDYPPCRRKALEAEHGSKALLHPTMILLDPIVQPLPTAVTSKPPKLVLSLHRPDRSSIAAEPICDDDPWIARVVPTQHTAEEAPSCLHVSLGAEQEVDGLAGAVDRTIKVAPAAADPDVCLI